MDSLKEPVFYKIDPDGDLQNPKEREPETSYVFSRVNKSTYEVHSWASLKDTWAALELNTY